MNAFDDKPGGERRRRNSVAPNPWRRGRRRPQPHDNPPDAARNGDLRRPMLAALFEDASHAERAHATLVDRGYRHEEIVVVMAEAKWEKLFGVPDVMQRDPAAQPGSRTAADRGAADAPVPLAIPSGEQPARVMAAGRIATMLANAARPRSENALREALIDCGIPARNAAECAAGVESGKILLGVVPRSDADATALGDELSRADGEVAGR
jgi:hypothetical protein